MATIDIDKMRAKADTLKAQLQVLSDINARLVTIRQHPFLLRSVAGGSNNNMNMNLSMNMNMPQLALTSVRLAFQDLNALQTEMLADKTQTALKAAREAEKADGADIGMDGRRDSRKRKRPPSPKSPEPFHTLQPNSQSQLSNLPFPISPDDPPALRVDQLVSYIRDHNSTHTSKLSVWLAARPRNASTGVYIKHPTDADNRIKDNPITVRFRIPDVLTVFMELYYEKAASPLVVETVTVFGPREKKSPKSYSDFMAFQRVAIYLMRVLRAQPNVPFQNLVDMLSSYESLFTERCPICERVLSAEGHIPPVARIWLRTPLGSGSTTTVTSVAPAPAAATATEPKNIEGEGQENTGEDGGQPGGADGADGNATGAMAKVPDRDREGVWAPRHVTCL